VTNLQEIADRNYILNLLQNLSHSYPIPVPVPSGNIQYLGSVSFDSRKDDTVYISAENETAINTFAIETEMIIRFFYRDSSVLFQRKSPRFYTKSPSKRYFIK